MEHLDSIQDSTKILISLTQDKIEKTAAKTKVALDRVGMAAGNMRSLLRSFGGLRLGTALAPLRSQSP